MRTFYAVTADAVLMLHVAYVAFVVVGLLLILVGAARGWDWIRNFRFRAVHLAMIAAVVAEAVLGITCPLTTWERQLRRLAGQQVHHEGFIAYYLHRVLFFELPPWVFTVIYILFGLAVLATWVWAPPPGVGARRSEGGSGPRATWRTGGGPRRGPRRPTPPSTRSGTSWPCG